MKLGDQFDAVALCPAFQRPVGVPNELVSQRLECGDLDDQWSDVWAACRVSCAFLLV